MVLIRHRLGAFSQFHSPKQRSCVGGVGPPRRRAVRRSAFYLSIVRQLGVIICKVGSSFFAIVAGREFVDDKRVVRKASARAPFRLSFARTNAKDRATEL